MSKKQPDIAKLRARAFELKAQLRALGALCDPRTDFEENHPAMAIEFYKRVLAEDMRINGPSASGIN